MKKIIALILAAGISATQFTAFAANETIDVQVNEISVYADGKYIDSDNFLYRDRTFIPLRGVLEALKCEVFYDEQTNSANAYNVVEMVLDIYRVATSAYQSITSSDDRITIALLLYNLNNYELYNDARDTYISYKNTFETIYEPGKGVAEIGLYTQSFKINYIAEKTQELLDTAKTAFDLGEKVINGADEETSNNYYECIKKVTDLYNDIVNTVGEFGYNPY